MRVEDSTRGTELECSRDSELSGFENCTSFVFLNWSTNWRYRVNMPGINLCTLKSVR